MFLEADYDQSNLYAKMERDTDYIEFSGFLGVFLSLNEDGVTKAKF